MMRTRLPRAILIDLDDTILALSDTADSCWLDICQQFASQVDGLSPARLFDAIKESTASFWGDEERVRWGRLNLRTAQRQVVAGAFARLDIGASLPSGLIHEMADTYTAVRIQTLHPFPGAIEAIHTFRARSIRLALVTNGSGEFQRRKVERFGLESLFDCIVIEGEFGVGKPDERVFRHALEQLDAEPQETWMVGDNLVADLAVPQKMGITVIWHDYAGEGLPEPCPVCPDRIVRSLAELAADLKG